jgi:serine/threonine-protein kinase RsbW
MTLKIRADLGQLDRIRKYVANSATELGASPAVLDDLRLAVDEAVTNVLIHGYGGAGDIELTLEQDGSDLRVVLRDHAPPSDAVGDAPQALDPPEERASPGGFGIYLIHSMMDEVIHRETADGNELTLIKRGVIGQPV